MLNYIITRPVFSHGVLGVLYTALLLLAFDPPTAFTIVASVFYGREIGQLGHDLQAKGASRFTAWWRSLLLDLDLWEVVQVLAPVISAGAVAGGAHVLTGMALPVHLV